jgi:ferredoxin-NADP reductase
MPDGRVRQYSLCGNPADHARYDIAIKREAAGRGGSMWAECLPGVECGRQECANSGHNQTSSERVESTLRCPSR